MACVDMGSGPQQTSLEKVFGSHGDPEAMTSTLLYFNLV